MNRCRRVVFVCCLLGVAVVAGACSSSFGMPRGVSEQAHETFTVWQIFFVAAIAVAGLVYFLIFWSVFRYRRRRSDPDEVLKPYHESVPLEIVYTAVPVLIVVVLFVISVRANDRVTALAPDPSLTVRVEAFTWGWRFAYPGGVEVVSPPSSETTAGPVLMLPHGETVRFQLTSNETIHAFWVPEFLYKKDAIPGRTFEFDVTPTAGGARSRGIAPSSAD